MSDSPTVARGPGFLDFVGTTVLSGVASRMAANNASGTLRIPIRSGVDSIWNDVRTWLGIGGAAMSAFVPRQHRIVRGVAFNVGLGAATSLAATEQVRAVTVGRMQAGAPIGLPGPAAQAQLAAPVPAAQVRPVPQVRAVPAGQPAVVGYGVW